MYTKQLYFDFYKADNIEYSPPIKPSVGFVSKESSQVENPFILAFNPWYMAGAILAKFINFRDFTLDTRSNLKFKESKEYLNNKAVRAAPQTLNSISSLYGISLVRCPKCSHKIPTENIIRGVEKSIAMHLLRPGIILLPDIGKLINSIGTATNTLAGTHHFDFVKRNDDGSYYFDNGNVSFPIPKKGGRIPSSKIRFVLTQVTKTLMTAIKEYLFLRYSPASPLISDSRRKAMFKEIKDLVYDFCDNKTREEQDEYASEGFNQLFYQIKEFFECGYLTEESAKTVLNGDSSKFNRIIVSIVKNELDNNINPDIGYYNYSYKDDKFTISDDEEDEDEFNELLNQINLIDIESDSE